jgi:hypothetical protein
VYNTPRRPAAWLPIQPARAFRFALDSMGDNPPEVSYLEIDAWIFHDSYHSCHARHVLLETTVTQMSAWLQSILAEILLLNGYKGSGPPRVSDDTFFRITFQEIRDELPSCYVCWIEWQERRKSGTEKRDILACVPTLVVEAIQLDQHRVEISTVCRSTFALNHFDALVRHLERRWGSDSRLPTTLQLMLSEQGEQQGAGNKTTALRPSVNGDSDLVTDRLSNNYKIEDAIRKGVENGMTDQQIGEELGLNRATINKRRNKLGIAPSHQRGYQVSRKRSR